MFGNLNITLIAKPMETDFEQSLLIIFDCRKATNCAQNLYYQMYCQQITVRNMTKPARHASRLVAKTKQSYA